MIHGVMLQGFEWYLPSDGKHWQRLRKEAKNLQKAGFTAIWLPPAYKGNGGINDTGYGAYDLYDLGEFDQKGTVMTKYGTKDEYLSLIDELHRNDIDVYADMVFNHKMGADACEKVDAIPVAWYDRTKPVGQEEQIEAWTVFNFPGRHDKYSSFHWHYPHFDGVDFDNRSKKHNIYVFEGARWEQEVAKENGNYDYLMGADLNFDNPDVVQELKNYGLWYLDMTKVDGFRMDACKHIRSTFFKEWLDHLRQQTQKELFTVGEYWSADVQELTNFLQDNEFKLSVFDVSLHYNFYAVNNANGNYDMRKILNNTMVERFPQNAVTFVENHDTQKGQALQTVIADWFKPIAYGLILLRTSGYPCVFYGDYFGNTAMGIKSFRKVIDKMLAIRRSKLEGQEHNYFDDPDVIGWSYDGNGADDKGCAVIISDRFDAGKHMYVGKQHANKNFIDALGHFRKTVMINNDGWGYFLVKGGSISCWIAK